MTNYNVGDRVRVIGSPHEGTLPIGTTGTVVEVVEPLGFFFKADEDANLLFGPGFLTGDGYPLVDEEVEAIAESATA